VACRGAVGVERAVGVARDKPVLRHERNPCAGVGERLGGSAVAARAHLGERRTVPTEVEPEDVLGRVVVGGGKDVGVRAEHDEAAVGAERVGAHLGASNAVERESAEARRAIDQQRSAGRQGLRRRRQ
jgi:hypothetical protein